MKGVSYTLVVVFCLVLAAPILGDIFWIGATDELLENRLTVSSDNASFLQTLARYVKNYDREFWGRQYLVRSFIKIKKDFFGVSPVPEKVVIGKDGWLYLADYGAMDDCRNSRPFTREKLDSIRENLLAINDALAKSGIKFYVVVVPDKHTIYPEFLPEGVSKVRPESRLEQLVSDLKNTPSLRFIDLTDTLRSTKEKGVLYLREESHWNDLGAFVGYHRLLKSVQFDFPEVEVLSLDACRSFRGQENDLDLAKMLGRPIEYSEESLRIVPKDSHLVRAVDPGVVIPEAKRFNKNYAFRRKNDRVSGPAAVVYRDSFFSSLTPFVEQSFSESTYIWTNDVDIAYVEKQNVQIVILEIAERHIDLLAQ